MSVSKEEVLKSCMTATPRGGGYLSYLLPASGVEELGKVKDIMSPVSCPCSLECKQKAEQRLRGPIAVSSNSTTTRDYRVKAAEQDWDVSTIDSYENDDSILAAEYKVPCQLNLLPVVISTVMLLAAGKQVPPDQLDASAAFLECITNDENIPPPNIQGVMNEIAAITGRKQSPYSTHNKVKNTVLTVTKP